MQQPNSSSMNKQIDLRIWHEARNARALNFDLLKPLDEKLNDGFENAIKQLTRPYLAITKAEYQEILQLTESHGDVVLYDGIKMTFGNADGGWALMPLASEYQDGIFFITSWVDDDLTGVDWKLNHSNDSSQNCLLNACEQPAVDLKDIAMNTAMGFFLADYGDRELTKTAILTVDEKPDDVFVVERFEYDPWEVVCNYITQLSDEIEGAFQEVLLKLNGDSVKTKRFINQLLKANCVDNLEVVDLGEQVVFNKCDLDPNYSRQGESS